MAKRSLWRAVLGMFRPRAANELISGMTLEEVAKAVLGGGATSDAGITVNIRNAEGLAAVAASVRVLSEALAHLPLVTYRRNGTRRDAARDLPLYRLLHDQPNEWQTSYQWRKLKMRDLLYRGNAYSMKVMARGEVQELIRLHPDAVRIKQDETTLAVSYEYTRPDGRRVMFRRDQILHIWKDSDDGLVGINPLQTYRDAIGDGLAIRQHGSKFFRNAARPGVVLELAEGMKMGGEAQKALLKDFDSLYTGPENAWRTAFLPAGVKANPVSINMEDAQWIEARKVTAREIFGIFGIPPHKGGDLSDATFSNIEHSNLEFVIDSLTPHLVAWEQALNRDLLPDIDVYFTKFNVSALLRGDALSRAQALNIQRRAGIINANEWRALEDMNPRDDDGGEEYIVEQNMRPQDGTNPMEKANA